MGNKKSKSNVDDRPDFTAKIVEAIEPLNVWVKELGFPGGTFSLRQLTQRQERVDFKVKKKKKKGVKERIGGYR